MSVPHAVDLGVEQRLAVAQVTVAAQDWALGDRRHRPRTEAVAALRQISTDPAVLGVALGRALAHVELDALRVYEPLVELYRVAGADEQVAADHLAWQRTQYRQSLIILQRHFT